MNTHARTHTYVCMYKYIFVSVSGKRDTNQEVLYGHLLAIIAQFSGVNRSILSPLLTSLEQTIVPNYRRDQCCTRGSERIPIPRLSDSSSGQCRERSGQPDRCVHSRYIDTDRGEGQSMRVVSECP